MIELQLGCDPVLLPGTPTTATITLTPTDEMRPGEAGDVAVHLQVSTGVLVQGFRLTLGDDTPLVARVRRKGGVYVVACGPVLRPVRLTCALRAASPVVQERARVTVSVGERSEAIELRMGGRAQLLAERCHVGSDRPVVEAGGTFELMASLINDGAASADGELRISVPDGANVPTPPVGAWWSLDSAGTRRLVLPTGRLPIGEIVSIALPMQLENGLADGVTLRFASDAVVAGETFSFAESVISVASSVTVCLTVAIGAGSAGARAFRCAEHLTVGVHVCGLGNGVVRDVAITVASDCIVWDDAAPGQMMSVSLDELRAGAETTLFFAGRITTSPAGRGEGHVRAAATVGGVQISEAAAVCSLEGEPRIEASGEVGDADADAAHEVRLTLRNVGDGDAESLILRTERVDGVRFVVDSLLVDDEPVYELDGSLRVASPEGTEVGPLRINGVRTVAWRVRAEHEGRFEIPLCLRHGALERFANVAAVLSCGAREPLPPAPPMQAPTEPALVQPPAWTELDLEEGPSETGRLPDRWLEAIVPVEPQPPAPAALEMRHKVDAVTFAMWSTWVPAAPAPGDPLARYLLAARAFLPRELASAPPPVAALLLGLLSEVEAVHVAIARSSCDAGDFAPAGFDFATGPLRATVRSLAEPLGFEPDDLEGIGLERALIRLIAAEEPPYATLVAELRAVLLTALDRVSAISQLGIPAPAELLAAARRIHAALAPVGADLL